MKADAIIFDKDGTLLDFDAFWITVTEKAMADVFSALSMPNSHLPEILEALGVHNGTTEPDGALCQAPYEEIGQIVYGVLVKHGCPAAQDAVVRLVTDGFSHNATAGNVRPTCPNLKEILQGLKDQGKILALVTTDNPFITETCLKGLGIDTLFDAVYTDDGKLPAKPDPYCALHLCSSFGIDKQALVMVGDTLTDIRFARNAGIPSVGLARSEGSRGVLSGQASVVISDLSQLEDALQQL